MELILGILTLLAPAVLLAAPLFAASRRGRLGPVFLATIVLLATAWALSAIALVTDFRDADGFVDCWPSCSVLQGTVGYTFFYAPIYAVVLAILAVVLAVRERRKRSSLLP